MTAVVSDLVIRHATFDDRTTALFDNGFHCGGPFLVRQ